MIPSSTLPWHLRIFAFQKLITNILFKINLEAILKFILKCNFFILAIAFFYKTISNETIITDDKHEGLNIKYYETQQTELFLKYSFERYLSVLKERFISEVGDRHSVGVGIWLNLAKEVKMFQNMKKCVGYK